MGGAYDKKNMGDIFLGGDFLVGAPCNLELCDGLMQYMLIIDMNIEEILTKEVVDNSKVEVLRGCDFLYSSLINYNGCHTPQLNYVDFFQLNVEVRTCVIEVKVPQMMHVW